MTVCVSVFTDGPVYKVAMVVTVPTTMRHIDISSSPHTEMLQCTYRDVVVLADGWEAQPVLAREGREHE